VNFECLKNLSLDPGSREEIKVDLLATQPDPTKIPAGPPPYSLQTAIRCTLDEFYFHIPIMICVLFEPQTHMMSPEQYQPLFLSIQTTKDSGLSITNINTKYQSVNSVNKILYFYLY
jgi:hypothetical protein